jgi:hypothetical protein
MPDLSTPAAGAFGTLGVATLGACAPRRGVLTDSAAVRRAEATRRPGGRWSRSI